MAINGVIFIAILIKFDATGVTLCKRLDWNLSSPSSSGREIAQDVPRAFSMFDVILSVKDMGPIYPHTMNTAWLSDRSRATTRQVAHPFGVANVNRSRIEHHHIRV